MKKQRIALNGRFSGTLQPTGTQTVAFHLFDAIIKAPRSVDLILFADSAHPGIESWANQPGVEWIETPFSKWSRTRAQLWEQAILPIALKKQKCDLVHHPIMTCPRWKLGTPSIVTLHDLNFYHHPEWAARSFRKWLMATALPGMRQANHVVAVSQYVLEDARKTWNLSPQKTSCIHNGLKSLPALGSAVPEQPPRILGVNLWQPHKNLLRLLDAFEALRCDKPELELHLVGRPQAHYKKQPMLQSRLTAPGIRILGYLSEEELGTAYAQATVFCYPSLTEGFGLPVLEAMAAGLPVVTSNTTSLPEVSGGAAILIDPTSLNSLLKGLQYALDEPPDKRVARIIAGKKVAASFQWEDAALAYIKLYERIFNISAQK